MFRSRKLINNFIFSKNHQCDYMKTISRLLNNPRGWEIVRKINISLRGQMYRYTSKPERGLYLFYNPLINFFICNMLGEKEKQTKQDVSARANDANKHIDWLFFFFLLKLWLDQRCFPLYRIDQSETTQINQWENGTRPNQKSDRIDCWVMCDFPNSPLNFM